MSQHVDQRLARHQPPVGCRIEGIKQWPSKKCSGTRPPELQPPPPPPPPLPQCVFCKIFLKHIKFPQSKSFCTFYIIWWLNFIWQRTLLQSSLNRDHIWSPRHLLFLLRDVSVVNGEFWISWRLCSLLNSAFIPEPQPPVCSKMKGIFSPDLGKIIHPVWLDHKYIYIYF